MATIVRGDGKTLALLMGLGHLWNYEQYLQIVNLIKQVKWFEGVEIVLNSKTSHELFLNSNLQQRFRFIRDLLVFPFKS